MKKTILVIIAMVILIPGYFAYIYWALGNDSAGHAVDMATTTTDYKNIAYKIDGVAVQLSNGLAEVETAPGSATMVITKYFGNDLKADLNNDGQEDMVFLLTQDTGGSGVFYYAVAALKTADGYVGSDGYLLGDRIAPQTTEISQNPQHKNVIVVNYADRAKDEPMTTAPSVGKSVYLKLDAATRMWGTVEADFEGEADQSRMSLTMKEWTWVSSLYNDGRTVTPTEAGRFTLTFTDDGRFSATTDCNGVSGSYSSDDNSVLFKDIAMTKMYCENSQEQEFLSILEHTAQYQFTSRGELILGFKFDSGTATFK